MLEGGGVWLQCVREAFGFHVKPVKLKKQTKVETPTDPPRADWYIRARRCSRRRCGGFWDGEGWRERVKVADGFIAHSGKKGGGGGGARLSTILVAVVTPSYAYGHLQEHQTHRKTRIYTA